MKTYIRQGVFDSKYEAPANVYNNSFVDTKMTISNGRRIMT